MSVQSCFHSAPCISCGLEKLTFFLKNLEKQQSWKERASALISRVQLAIGKSFLSTAQLNKGLTALQRNTAMLYFNLAAEKEGNPEAEYCLGLLHYYGRVRYTEKGFEVKKDVRKAFVHFSKAAEGGFRQAEFYLGEMHYYGRGTEKNIQTAFHYFNQAALKSHPTTQFYLGLMHYSGEGTEKNVDKAFDHFFKATQKGNVKAEFYLGKIYYDLENYEQAICHFFKAGEDPQALYYLGKIYFNQGAQDSAFIHFSRAADLGFVEGAFCAGYLGYYKVKDFKAAFKYFTKAAEKGHPAAQYYLGRMYLRGDAVEQDDWEGFKYVSQSAQQDYPESLTFLAQWYYEGNAVVEKDAKLSFHYLYRAVQSGEPRAKKLSHYYGKELPFFLWKDFAMKYFELEVVKQEGDPEADYNLGLLHYTKARRSKLKKAGELSFYYFSKAAKRGNWKADFYLGSLFLDEERFAAASSHFLRGAEKDDDPAIQYELGKIHCEKNRKRALNYLTKAAAKGHAEAACFLGRDFLAIKHFDTALTYFIQSAERGHSQGQWYLSPKNYNWPETERWKIFKYMHAAAQKNYAFALYTLGSWYYEGDPIIVEKDLKRAYHYLSCAHRLGDLNAQDLLIEIEET